MNIKQAKQEITNTLKAYLAKDQLGNYLIPTVRQRPVLLMGPPGVGKTQIMEQIAAETGVGLVAYTITHHTRQSAIGLPFIEKRTYGGEEVSVTEYTMSEILSSVYQLMERTGLQEGILFLDEINCVSETLAPMMLQFLHPDTGTGIGRHTQIATRRYRYRTYLRSIRQAGTFELLTEKSAIKSFQPFLNGFCIISSGKSIVCQTINLFRGTSETQNVIQEEIMQFIRSHNILCLL